MRGYQELVKHLQACTKQILKQMQRSSSTIEEYLDLCSRYESFKFDKLEEVELFYLMTRKHYLCKSFAAELAVKLENNKFSRTGTLSATSSGSSDGGVPARVSSPTMGSSFQNLSLH